MSGISTICPLPTKVKANRAVKFEVNLSTERNNTSLTSEIGISDKKPFLFLTIFRVGNGSFTIRMYFTEDNYIEFSSDELNDGDVFDYEFVDLTMTNTSQTAINPVFVIDWRE